MDDDSPRSDIPEPPNEGQIAGVGEKPVNGGSEGRLTARQRVLVRLSAALAAAGAAAEGPELEAAMAAAAREAEADEVEETLIQSYLFLGYPAALNALRLWREVSGRSAGDPSPEDAGEHARRGEAVCRRVYGGEYEGLRANVRSLHPDVERWMVAEGYGKVLGRPGLDLATRELCIAALLAVADAPVQLYSHLRGALHVGASPDTVEASLEEGLRLVEPAAARRGRRTWRRVKARHARREDEGRGDRGVEPDPGGRGV